nr:BPK_HP1_G0043560.mRNA.1.CDS.1 [Saccharomyces cerevisiae]
MPGDMKENSYRDPRGWCGGLSHTLTTTFPKIQVDSIELSALMYICNLFALEYKHMTLRYVLLYNNIHARQCLIIS